MRGDASAGAGPACLWTCAVCHFSFIVCLESVPSAATKSVQNCPWFCYPFTVIRDAVAAIFKAAFASTGDCKKGMRSDKHPLGHDVFWMLH